MKNVEIIWADENKQTHRIGVTVPKNIPNKTILEAQSIVLNYSDKESYIEDFLDVMKAFGYVCYLTYE